MTTVSIPDKQEVLREMRLDSGGEIGTIAEMVDDATKLDMFH